MNKRAWILAAWCALGALAARADEPDAMSGVEWEMLDEGEQQLLENYLAVIDEIIRARPSAAKGKYVKTLTVSTTMGPGVPIDTNRIKGTSEVAQTA